MSTLIFKNKINIPKICQTLAYIMKPNYSDMVEHHKYWEFVYVHKGKLSISAENKIFDLKEGDLIIHPPFQKHKIEHFDASKTIIVVCSFLESSNLLYKLEKNKFSLNLKQKKVITDIFGDLSILSKYNEHNTHLGYDPRGLSKNPLHNQLVKNYLEIFLIDLILDQNSEEKEESFHHNVESNKAKCENIISYMQNNLYKNLTLDDICRYSYLGKTSVSTMFKKHTNMSVMKYFTYLKVQKAKELLKADESLDEISKALNFTSQNYFSRAFKSIEGVSPFKYRQKHQKLSKP